ncbi:aliphatic sulfonate ABC transporter substrate-binding protein [Herbaspirillum chlorophenolicum]|uniref:Aliphatic sulfonate ABC transporter substrate-binding protein n=1 Tax=Herbaspirillum chlorophenolicum TaxID=211589 RepID=A0ABW8EVY2_9BURK
MSKHTSPDLARRHLLQAGAAIAAAALAPSLLAQNSNRAIRIGYQKSSTLLTIIKANGSLEKLLAPGGAKISWHEFSSGLPLLEALNVGGVDLSADVADTVPVFAQAAGARLTYLAQESPSPSAQAIVVRADSPIRGVAELKRKKIAVTKAAGVHYLLIATLEKAGLKFSDVEAAYLSPADGRAAFERGSVDAWVTWDPFLSGVQRQSQVRVLSDGRGIADYQRYYLASTPFADANPDVLRAVFDELQKTGQWVKRHPKEAAAFLAPLWGLDTDTIELANSRRSYEVRAVKLEALGEQQRIADTFFSAGLLPKKVNTADVAIWKPERLG